MEPYIVDSTLRDGEQAPGVAFCDAAKFKIAEKLNDLKIREVEVGTPAMGKNEQHIIREIATADFLFKTISWCRALKSDIDAAYACKTDAVSISFPVSECQLKALGKTEHWVFEQMLHLISYAKTKFEKVIVGLQDASRSSHDDLNRFIDYALYCNADRIRIADTVGILTPVSTMELFKKLLAVHPKADFEFHAHNDLGMATANAFVAIESGASGVSGTLNGIGERAGNMAIEEFMMAQFMNNGQKSDYRLQQIKSACHAVSKASKMPLHKAKPIVGENAFSHETGIHVKSILKNKLTYQPFCEAIVGANAHKIVIGKHSGKAALNEFLRQNHLTASIKHMEIFKEKIAKTIQQENALLSNDALLGLYHEVVMENSFNKVMYKKNEPVYQGYF